VRSSGEKSNELGNPPRLGNGRRKADESGNSPRLRNDKGLGARGLSNAERQARWRAHKRKGDEFEIKRLNSRIQYLEQRLADAQQKVAALTTDLMGARELHPNYLDRIPDFIREWEAQRY
jgi:hypothetical protein